MSGADAALGVAVLASGAALQRNARRPWEIPAGLALAGGTVAFARSRGATWSDLGLETQRAGAGLRAAAIAAPAVCAAVASGAAWPQTRTLFRDERVERWSRTEAAYQTLLRVPLATAVTEELVFRSAILGLALHRDRSPWRAALWTSALFGLWHVIPALESHGASTGHARLADRVGGRATTVVTSVLGTAVAGAGLAWLRLRSRSVVAPIAAHAAVNIAAILAARRVARRHVR